MGRELRSCSGLPFLCLLAKDRRFRENDAKALPGRGLEYPPGVDLLHALGSESLEPSYLGVDVVRFDIEVNATGVRYRLHLDMQPAAGIDQLDVLVLLAGKIPDLHAERAAPERGRRLQIVRPAIDAESSQPALVHGAVPFLCSLKVSVLIKRGGV